jgi:hypothetical protein
LVKSFSKI